MKKGEGKKLFPSSVALLQWHQCKYWINIAVIDANQVLVVVSVPVVDFPEPFGAGVINLVFWGP